MSCAKSRKNVLIVNQLEQLYGAEMSLLELVRVLDGFEPIVMTAGEGALKAGLEKIGVLTLCFDFRGNRDSTDRERAASMREILDKYEIDLVHYNKPQLNRPHRMLYAEAMREVTRATRLPMIAHVRGAEVSLDRMQMRLLAQMDRIVCVSQRTRQELLQQEHAGELRSREDAIEVVYNGRTLQNYKFSCEKRRRMRGSLGIGEDEFVVGLVARFNPTKGQDRLVELAARFQPSDGVRFLLVGDLMEPADAVYREQVLRSIRKGGLESRVLLTGYLQGAEIMSGLDLVLSLSQTEGLPGVVIEAMAAGRCVVANPVGGIPEMIGSDGAGYCVQKNDLPAVERVIRLLRDDQDLAQTVGERARTRAGELFAASRYGRDITRVYREVLERGIIA